MEKKYRLLENDTITVSGRTLYRIEALRDFADVKKGDKGGYIESEDNLSHDGNCWVGGKACVFGNARVADNARAYGRARVYEKAYLLESALVFGSACISGTSIIWTNAMVGKGEISKGIIE